MYISKRLKELRTVSGFSQEKLAELLDVSRQTISSWENERSYPDVHNLIMLCDIYSVSLDDLMKGDIETMKKEVANTTLNKSPQDAIQLIQSGLVMIIGLLIAVTGLIITLNGGSTLWGYGLMIIGAALACFFAFYADYILARAESPDDIRADCTGPQNSNRFDLHVSLSPFACSTFSIPAGNRCISLGLLYHKGTLWFNYCSIV